MPVLYFTNSIKVLGQQLSLTSSGPLNCRERHKSQKVVDVFELASVAEAISKAPSDLLDFRLLGVTTVLVYREALPSLTVLTRRSLERPCKWSAALSAV